MRFITALSARLTCPKPNARPIRHNGQVSDRNGKIFCTSIASLSHISKVSWCPFTLYDYLTLRTIYYFNNLRQPFCIDNTMNIFVGNKMGLLFYRRKRIGKDNWEFETVSESFQKELRKLFATGLLHAYTCKKTRSIQVYITEAGLSMIKDTDLENNNFVKHYLQFKTDPTFSSCLQLPTQNKKYKPFRSPMDNPPEQMVE